VCLNCKFWDLDYSNQCRENQAELVREKDKANFCEYYKPLDILRPEVKKDKADWQKIESLFSGSQNLDSLSNETESSVIDSLEDLFKKKK
tara:strand:+ start:213 stop:482 length:270 start_codon:yes stop_codon:yes gene_type:complete